MKNKLLMLRTSALLIMMFVALLPIVVQTDSAESVTVTYQVVHSWDDRGVHDHDTVHPPWTTIDGLTINAIPFGCVSPTVPTWKGGGFRFQSVQVPKGAVIVSAKLKLFEYNVDLDTDRIPCYVKIQGEDTDDATWFNTAQGGVDYNSRVRTTAKISWSIPDIPEKTWYETPDISSVIQEIVARSGWSSGNDMVIFVEDDGTPKTDDYWRHALSYDGSIANYGSNAYAVKLEITYSTELKIAIDAGLSYIDRLYEVNGTYDYVKEYPAFPLGIYVSTGKWYLLGADYSPPISTITVIGQTSTYDHFTIKFADMEGSQNYNFELDVYRYYYTDGSTKYKVTFVGYTGDYAIDLYLGDEKIISGITKNTGATVVEKWKYNYQCYPSNRYTVRHGAQLSSLIYHIWGTKWSGQYLDNLINDFGFTYDIYDPMFFESVGEGDGFMFNAQAYHDVDVYGTLPRGMNPHRYPYKSKVGINRDAYIIASFNDPLLRALSGIHICNKYNDPDHIVVWTPDLYWSARSVARWIEANYWNGYGVAVPLKDKVYASGVRSAVFLVLETLLGYKYNDATSKSYADSMADVMVKAQWRSDGYGETADYGVILRPPHAGGFLLSWKTGTSYPYAVSPRTFLEEILDMFSMPPEEGGVVPTNVETTATCLQALRVFLYYKYGVAYPNATNIP